MAAQTVYPMGVGMFTPTSGMPLGGEGQALADISRTDLAAPQLVMLANVALTSDGSSCDCLMEEKQMVELKTVGSGSYSDSEDDGLVRYGYDSHAETPAGFYPEAQQATASQAEEEEDEGVEEGDDQPSPPENGHASTGGKRKRSQRSTEVSAKKKKPFHCKPCQYQAECEEEFVHHIRVHSAKKLIVVGRADGEEPAKEPPLPEGGESVVYTKGVIRCERCGYNTNRYDHYMAHLKHHSKEGDSQRVYKCTICTYTTVSQYHWKKHLRNHFPSKLYTCAQCCYFSDRKNNYVQHIRTHTGERPFRCPYCKYSSSQKTHLTRHMRTHSGERPFKCDSCSYLAANQHEVTRHARQVHNGPKPLSCPHCQYKTADRSNYKKHVELHVNPRQFLCPVCSYAASKKCNLQYHIKSRHPDCSEITMDVSKVKLRVKKPEAAPACYNVGGNSSYALTEAQDGKEQLEEKTDEPENADPVNLSTGKSRSAPAPRDKAQRKGEGISEDESVEKGGEKLSLQRAEKKEKSGGKAVKNAEKVKEAKRAGKATKPVGGVGNGRPRRERKAGRSATHAEEKVEKKKERERAEKKEKERADRLENERVEREKADRLENERVEREREEKKRAEEKETKNSVKSVKGASKKTDKTEKHAEERVKEKAPESQKPLETTQKKGMKTYNGKRKFVNEEPCPPEKEAPEQPSVCRTSKRRKDTDKHAQKDSLLRGRRKTCPATKSKAKLTKRIDWPVGVQQKKKTKKRQSEKKLSPEGTGEAVEIKGKTSEENAAGPMQNEEIPITDLQEVAAKPSAQMASPPQGSTTGQSIIQEVPQMMETPLGSLQVSVEQVRVEERTEKEHEEANCEPKETLETCSSSGSEESSDLRSAGSKVPHSPLELPRVRHKPADTEESSDLRSAGSKVPHSPLELPRVRHKPAVTEESSDLRSAGSKVPHSPLELPRVRHKPADTEEDEGIHSHDGSDISDSVSEGSDDSGLSVLQAASDPAAKVSAPETPAEEPCVPATLHSHTCIFCDRSFSMEVEYRRHLNRHLVNVYYLENAAEGDQ